MTGPARSRGVSFPLQFTSQTPCASAVPTSPHLQVRKDGTLNWVRPDGKIQVTVEYKNEGGAMVPIRVHTILISTQHNPEVTNEQIKADLIEKVIKPVVPAKYLDDKTIYHMNPSGRFVIGGPHGDAGLTGRKIIIDTYGALAHTFPCPSGAGVCGLFASSHWRLHRYIARFVPAVRNASRERSAGERH